MVKDLEKAVTHICPPPPSPYPSRLSLYAPAYQDRAALEVLGRVLSEHLRRGQTILDYTLQEIRTEKGKNGR